VSSWVTKPTGRRSGHERRHRHGAEKHNPRIVVKPYGERLEALVREHVQRLIQALLEEEVTVLLGRPKSVRLVAVDAPSGVRNGYGKPWRPNLSMGTITVRRPRIRGLGARFVSRVLPLYKRCTREVGELLPALYLHGLALGDFDLALRGLLGEAAPCRWPRWPG
jgi:putative transposase